MKIEKPKTLKECYRLLAGVAMTQGAGLAQDDVEMMLPIVDALAERLLAGDDIGAGLDRTEILQLMLDASKEG